MVCPPLFDRRLDIADVDDFKAIEHKTGYQSRTEDVRWELERDAQLVKQGWDIEWVFKDTASQPLINDLQNAGITIKYVK